MRTILFITGILCASTCHAMQPDSTTEELYALCQTWFQASHIRTIASHIENIRARKGSFVAHHYCVVQSDKAQAAFNAKEEVVNIHKIIFPGVPEGKVEAKIQFDEMLKIKACMDAKTRK